MPQVTRTTNDVIINAAYLIGELGVGEIPDSFLLSTGLEIINEILDGFSADSIYIPYLTTLNSVFVVGKDTYSISDMISGTDIVADRVIDLSFSNYTVQPQASEPIIYPLMIINKATYYNVVRLQNLQARPGFIFLNKQADESFVTVYPAPDQPYPFSIQVKSMLNSLTAFQDISELAPFYYGFLKYAVARELSSYYPSSIWDAKLESKYDDYISNIKNSNETDLTIRPSVTMTAPEPFYWPNILAY